jgi:hypothetical protein
MSERIACLFLNINFNKENYGSDNFSANDFFSHNAVNSFKKWHPDIDVHYITDENFYSYLNDLNITEYYNHVGFLRIHLIKELMNIKKYTKVIMLGIDTFTCSRLNEFLTNNEDDMICSSGPPYAFIKTEYWSPLVETFEYNGLTYKDVSFINADVVCFNNKNMLDVLYNISLNYWTDHAEQGGMNYCYINQKELGIKVSIVDFPYIKAKSLYNIRSKGAACGGNQMHQGKLYNGNYKDPNSNIISDVYPTSLYYIKDNKLYTENDKQIKVFHYAEALGGKNKEEYNETLNEIKTMWFNKETIEFLTNQCNCKF